MLTVRAILYRTLRTEQITEGTIVTKPIQAGETRSESRPAA
jgi:hypothetical protein